MTDELTRQVIDIVASSQGVDPSEIAVDSTFEELGIDSLQGLNLVNDLEDAFDIVIPNEVALNVKSVSQLVDELERVLSNPSVESPGVKMPEPDA